MQMIYWGQSNHSAGTARECAGGDRVAVAVHQGDRKAKGRSAQAQKMTGSTLLSHPVKRGLRCLALLMLAVSLGSATAHAQSASAWNKRGLNAEAREDWDTAYEAFHNAWLKKPKDMGYKVRMQTVMVNAAAMHVDRGRVLRQNNEYPAALREFMRALEIDPSDQVAEQEIVITQRKDQSSTDQAQPMTAPGAAGLTTSQAAEQELAGLGAPITLQPVSDAPLTLHTVEDVKVIYQALGKLAGINVLFDTDYNSKRIPVDLVNVDIYDALRIVGTISGTFWKPVTNNTIFVAQNTRNKHQDLDNTALQTFYLTNVSTPADANEMLTAIRNILDPQAKINLVPSQNALILRAPPDQLLMVQKLLKDLDRPKAEVVVDIAILEVNRDKVRNLGITLPQSFGLTPQATTTTASSTTNTSGSTSSGTSTTSSLTLNDLGNLKATNFGVTVTGATLNALYNDTDTRVLQNPRVRASDGQRALLKIGSKIPIATGSYNAGVSTGVASIGVQTQFSYQDVGVNIDMTPTVHYDHEVSLKLMMEVSTHSGDVNISGVTQPIISQRHAEQVIQLKEGEPAILAGVLDDEDNRTNSGTPGLAQIPILKYIFGSQYHENKRDEVIFVLVPHIVRESVLSGLNTRAIDTGSGQDITLRHVTDIADVDSTGSARPATTATPTATAAGAANAMIQRSPTAAANAANAAAMVPSSSITAAGPPVIVSVTPPNSTQTVGSTFQVALMLAGARDLASVPLSVQFNSQVLSLVNISPGDLLARDGQSVALVRNDPSPGLTTLEASRPASATGVTGQGTLCTLTFKAIAAGDSNVSLVKVGAMDKSQANLPAVGNQAVVHVK